MSGTSTVNVLNKIPVIVARIKDFLFNQKYVLILSYFRFFIFNTLEFIFSQTF